MTDVEPKTPNKRKSFAGKNKSPQKSPKIAKLENAITPKKVGTPQHQKTPQQNKSFQNSAKKSNKKANQKNGSPPKVLKPFGGTALVDTPKEKHPKKVEKEEKKDKKIKKEQKVTGQKNDKQDKKKKDPYFSIKEQLKSGDDAAKKEVAKTIEEKLKAIQARTALTKTALRKIKMLKRFQRIAEGQEPVPPQQKQPGTKGEASKRRERRKNAEKAQEGKMVKKEKVGQGVRVEQVAKPKNQRAAKKAALKVKPEPEDDSSDEDDEDFEVNTSLDDTKEEDDSGEEEEESGEEQESGEEEDDSGEEEDDSGKEEDSGEEDESEDEEVPPPPQEKKQKTVNPNKPTVEKKPKKPQGIKEVDLTDLKTNDLVAKNQKRYVVFVGNIPYDTNKQDLMELFQNCGDIKHVRIPTEKKSTRPRGFAYVEAANEETYQKCLSKHHTFLKGRRVNVLYTQGGKKKGDDKKKEIKAKNFKLDAMRKKGMILGSKKESQRRSFRRKKQSLNKNAGGEGN